MAQPAASYFQRSTGLVATLAACLMLGACAQTGDSLETSLLEPKLSATKTADAADDGKGKTELEKATDYWGKKYKEHPTNLEAGLSFAKNLKAMGERQQAMGVIQQLAVFHGNDRKLASEYGRLALELDQISVAKTMLAIADDPAAPDWKVISARGTVLAKEGKFREAVPLYEKALSLSQDQTSVMNNLAMAYAMGGDAAKAEDMLRRIEAKGGSAKSRQNLALVLGLQGKFEEGRQVASQDVGADAAAADADYLKRMVKVDTGKSWAAKSTASTVPVVKASAAASDRIAPAPPQSVPAEGSSGLKGMSP